MAYRIMVAEHAGACYGVNRALEMVEEAASGDKAVHTLGPLIHNPTVVCQLKERGIDVAEDLDDIPSGDIVVIRSHGVAPEVIREAHEHGLIVRDATCPHVSKAQRAAHDLHGEGRLVIVIGEAGHPEVEAICAYAQGDVIIASGIEDVPQELPDRVGVVVQTTQSQLVFSECVEAIQARCKDVIVCDTICFATEQRQRSAFELAGKADCMLVIGGRNSGNTRRLFSICEGVCANTHHIESADELEDVWFEGCGSIGITAGASTPRSQIDSVIHAVEELG